jgi:hypothetical protein
MLEVVEAIGLVSKTTFTQAEISSSTSVGLGQVRLVFVRLEKAGYLSRDAKDRQEQPFTKKDRQDRFWEILPGYLEDLRERQDLS